MARRVETFAEYAAGSEVQFEAFETEGDELAEAGPCCPSWDGSAPALMHAVWMDGAIVCAGTMSAVPEGLLLYGGATSRRRAAAAPTARSCAPAGTTRSRSARRP